MKCAFKLNRQREVHHERGMCHGNNNKQSRKTVDYDKNIRR